MAHSYTQQPQIVNTRSNKILQKGRIARFTNVTNKNFEKLHEGTKMKNKTTKRLSEYFCVINNIMEVYNCHLR